MNLQYMNELKNKLTSKFLKGVGPTTDKKIGVYIIRRKGAIQYIGVGTKDVVKRSKQSLIRHNLGVHGSRIQYIYCNTKMDARILEMLLISEMKPPFNTRWVDEDKSQIMETDFDSCIEGDMEMNHSLLRNRSTMAIESIFKSI